MTTSPLLARGARRAPRGGRGASYGGPGGGRPSRLGRAPRRAPPGRRRHTRGVVGSDVTARRRAGGGQPFDRRPGRGRARCRPRRLLPIGAGPRLRRVGAAAAAAPALGAGAVGPAAGVAGPPGRAAHHDPVPGRCRVRRSARSRPRPPQPDPGQPPCAGPRGAAALRPGDRGRTRGGGAGAPGRGVRLPGRDRRHGHDDRDARPARRRRPRRGRERPGRLDGASGRHQPARRPTGARPRAARPPAASSRRVRR